MLGLLIWSALVNKAGKRTARPRQGWTLSPSAARDFVVTASPAAALEPWLPPIV
jgi:hypothetical protein